MASKARSPTGRFSYTFARWFVAIVMTDVALAVALVLVILASSSRELGVVLGVAIPIVLLWGFVTLHFPSRIELDPDAITFFAYGRAHRFALAGVSRIHVRRFVVRDRVLVRVVPSPPWRGRYWVLDSMQGFSELVSALEAMDRGRVKG